MKKNRRIGRVSNAIDPATTTNKNWGFNPVPGKGGNTTNSFITEKMSKKGLEENENGGDVNA